MNVTRKVVQDLVTLYLAGEASPDSRALVEEYLRTDPELARQVAASRQPVPDLGTHVSTEASGEKQALDATRKLLRDRTSTLVMAVLFTALPFSFTFRGSEVTFLMIRDAPVIATAWLATAAVMWVWHLVIRKRLQVSGL